MENFEKDVVEALNFLRICKMTGYLGGYEDLYKRLITELVLMKQKSGCFEYDERKQPLNVTNEGGNE